MKIASLLNNKFGIKKDFLGDSNISKQQLLSYFKLLRVLLGLLFLWSFFDKTLGLNFSTSYEDAWINGASPTSGFLMYGTSGIFKSIFTQLSGNIVVDWLFMLGLLGVGVSFTFNIFTKIGGYSGALMMSLIYLAAFPPVHHPFIDEHVVYIAICMMIAKISD